MKRIGIIGGIGPQATLFIYKKIIEISQDKYSAKNNDDYPDVIIASIPIPDFISSTENLNKARRMLGGCASDLVRAGCDALSIASNTVHILLKDLEAEAKVPFLSMVELVADKCEKLNHKKVALLGTPVLLNSTLYDDALSARNINLISPSPKQIKVCDKVIRLIIAGQSVNSVKEDYVKVLSSMLDQGADAIILGCTELPLVLDYEALGKRILSSDEILAEGISDFCYQRN